MASSAVFGVFPLEICHLLNSCCFLSFFLVLEFRAQTRLRCAEYIWAFFHMHLGYRAVRTEDKMLRFQVYFRLLPCLGPAPKLTFIPVALKYGILQRVLRSS